MLKLRFARLAVVGLLAAGLVGFVVPGPATAAVPGVPADCHAWAPAYASNGARRLYEYRKGAPRAPWERGNGIGFLPTAMTDHFGMGSSTSFQMGGYATSGAGGLYEILRRGVKTSSGWYVTTSRRLMATSWASTRGITVGFDQASGKNFIYRLGKGVLQRWTISGSRLVDYRLVSTRAAGILNVVGARTYGSGSTRGQALLANYRDGRLVELRVPVNRPAAYGIRTLRRSGWAFRTISTGYCTRGRPIMGITGTGRMAVFWDPRPGDGSGADFRGGYTAVRNWTLKSYGQ